MSQFCRAFSVVLRLAAFILGFQLVSLSARAAIRDGGIDPSNLGKGDWIYILPNAINHLGGNAPAVTDLASLMSYEKNQGMQYLIIKAGDGSTLYPSAGNPQLTSAVINAGHAAGLKIFGYNRSYGTDIAGELTISDYVFNQGGDGFVIDAEIEWESQNLPNNTVAASNLCASIRTNWPNKFLAHSPFAYISYHSSFPYKEFGYYCDVVMPQDYWNEISMVNCSPSQMVADMSSQWRNWQSSLSGKWTNSIKPICALGGAWNSTCTVTAAQITEFVNALKNDSNPATRGGYKAVNYWRAELHPADVLDGIRTNNIGNTPTNAPAVTNVAAGNVTGSSATITWTTDQSSDSVVEYGLTTGYGNAFTNPTPFYYHTVVLNSLAANTSYHYRVKSKNSLDNQGISGDYVFTTLSVTVSDVIVESRSGGQNFGQYSDSGAGFPNSWSDSGSKSTASGATQGIGSRFNTTAGIGGAATWFQVSPTLAVAGASYQVYVTVTSASGTINVTSTITQSGCSGLPATTTAFSTPGNVWNLVGTITLNAGVTTPTIRFDETANNNRFYADAVKFFYVPPPPSPPSIATQPQSQTINQGNSVTFSVVAAGTAPLTYQWHRAGTNIPTATASSYTKNNVQPADAGNYSVSMTNSIGWTNSANAALTVIVPPTISAQPQGVTTNAGNNVTFSVGAGGTQPLSYRWQLNGGDISGATTSTYTRNNVQTNDAGAYSVVVSNAAAVITSADAILTVNVPPSIVSQPQDQAVNRGSNATFAVTATGTAPLSYQWRFNSSSIAGATDSSYTRANAQTNDAGAYSVVVTNSAGSVVSSNATLTVNVLNTNPPHIDAISILPDGRAQLQVSGGPGNFAIEAAPAPSGFMQLSSLTATGAVFQYIDPDTNQSTRFYRIRVLP